MEIRKRSFNFFSLILIFFIIFIALYFTQITDLYEYNQYNKMSITKEAMERFESDVSSGKDITISDYLNPTYDYSNDISSLGYKTSSTLNRIMNGGLRKAFKVILSLFT